MKNITTNLKVQTRLEGKKIFIYFQGICDFTKQKKIKGKIILRFKNKKKYMKIDNVFSITKALISNDEDPSRKKSRHRATQRNMKV